MSLYMYLYDVTMPEIVVVVFTRPLGTSPSPLLVEKIFARFDESMYEEVLLSAKRMEPGWHVCDFGICDTGKKRGVYMITDTSTTHGLPPYASLSDTDDKKHILCIRSDMQDVSYLLVVCVQTPEKTAMYAIDWVECSDAELCLFEKLLDEEEEFNKNKRSTYKYATRNATRKTSEAIERKRRISNLASVVVRQARVVASSDDKWLHNKERGRVFSMFAENMNYPDHPMMLRCVNLTE